MGAFTLVRSLMSKFSFPYLLFSTWFTVSRVNVDGSNYSVVVDDTTFIAHISGIDGVDYHWRYYN